MNQPKQTNKIILCGNSAPAEMKLSGEDLPEFARDVNWSITKTTMRSGVSAGIELIEIDNGLQTVSILATRGMGLWKIQRDGIRFGWDSPVPQPVHPAFVNLKSRNNLGWVEGFNELLCRCGLSFNGPPGNDEEAPSGLESDITLHGQIANLPAESVSVEFDTQQGQETIVVRGVVRETSLFGPNLELQVEYQIGIASPEMIIRDTVINRASRPAELEMLYHINLGTPLLEEGASWLAPLKMLAPRDDRAAEDMPTTSTYLPPTAGYAEQVYFCELMGNSDQQTAALLKNSSSQLGFGIEFDLQSLPCFSIWKNTQAIEDGYCTGLEPSTNYPNFKSFERKQGRVISLPAGGSWNSCLKLHTLTDAQTVQAFEQKINAIQGKTEPTIYQSPQTGYSPGG